MEDFLAQVAVIPRIRARHIANLILKMLNVHNIAVAQDNTEAFPGLEDVRMRLPAPLIVSQTQTMPPVRHMWVNTVGNINRKVFKGRLQKLCCKRC